MIEYVEIKIDVLHISVFFKIDWYEAKQEPNSYQWVRWKFGNMGANKCIQLSHWWQYTMLADKYLWSQMHTSKILEYHDTPGTHDKPHPQNFQKLLTFYR